MKNLPKEVQAFIQLQMSQIFFNAENPNAPHITVTVLPRHNPAQSLAQNVPYVEPYPIVHYQGSLIQSQGQRESSPGTSDMLSTAMEMINN